MKPSNAHVVQAFDLVAHELGRDCRFLGDRKISRNRGGDNDCAGAGNDVLLAQRNNACDLVIRRTGHYGANGSKRLARRACHEQRRTAAGNLPGNGRNLIGRLTEAKNDFRKPLPDGAMVIDAREPKVFEWLSAERLQELRQRRLRVDASVGHSIEQFL